MKFSRSDFEMQSFESRRPSQPVRLQRVTYEDRSKTEHSINDTMWSAKSSASSATRVSRSRCRSRLILPRRCRS